MAEIVKMPRLSDTMTDGVVAKWHKKVGDVIQEGDLLADIETDKATMEFESFQEGVLLYIGVKENETAQVDSVLAILGEKGEDISSLLIQKEELQDGQNNDILDVENVDKNKEEKPPKYDNSLLVSQSNVTNSVSSDKRIKISPLAKKIAQDKNIDISKLTGTGDGGRIIKRDVAIQHQQGASDSMTNIKDEEIPVSQMRKIIASRLSESKFTSPHFYLNMEVEMDNLMDSRKLLNLKNTVKISFNDILVKAVSMALKKHPNINSSWHETHIKLHKNVNIGVAVSLDNGLLVPVIKNADLKTFSEISLETNELINKAKDNKLQPSEWESNTFTISNLGMFGIDDFTAIINPPDACILAVGAIKEKAIVKDSQIQIGNIMKLTLSCDHRLVDGVAGAKFLNTLKDMLESPLMMFS